MRNFKKTATRNIPDNDIFSQNLSYPPSLRSKCLQIDVPDVGMFVGDFLLDAVDLVAQPVDDFLAVLLHELLQLGLSLDLFHFLKIKNYNNNKNIILFPYRFQQFLLSWKDDRHFVSLTYDRVKTELTFSMVGMCTAVWR